MDCKVRQPSLKFSKANSQMSKPIILRADLSIQHHNIVRVSRPRLEKMIQRFAIRVDGRDEGIKIHTSSKSAIHSQTQLYKAYFKLIALPSWISSPAAKIVAFVI
jgi:hypothetical protein